MKDKIEDANGEIFIHNIMPISHNSEKQAFINFNVTDTELTHL